MAVYSSSPYSNNLPPATHGQAGNLQTAYFLVTTTAALTTSDTLNFGYLPANARIHGMSLKAATAMDTNGSPTLTINVGDSGSAARYFSASTIAKAGGVDKTMTTGGTLFKTTAKTLIVGVPGTGAATGAAGTLELSVTYVVEDSATS